MAEKSNMKRFYEPVKPHDPQRWLIGLYGYELMLESKLDDVDLSRWCSTMTALLDLYDRTFPGRNKYPAYNQAFPLGPGTVADSQLATLPRVQTSGSWKD